MIRRHCPICNKPVHPTMCRNIEGHHDKSGTRCPASGEPYHITNAA